MWVTARWRRSHDEAVAAKRSSPGYARTWGPILGGGGHRGAGRAADRGRRGVPDRDRVGVEGRLDRRREAPQRSQPARVRHALRSEAVARRARRRHQARARSQVGVDSERPVARRGREVRRRRSRARRDARTACCASPRCDSRAIRRAMRNITRHGSPTAFATSCSSVPAVPTARLEACYGKV